MIDINCDLGEGAGSQYRDRDKELMKYITSANIACGLHAGNSMIMRETIRMAKEHHVAIGAHPSLPDKAGFGRREMYLPPEEIKKHLISQISVLQDLVQAEGLKLQHIKPHGALYHMAIDNEEMAQSIARAVKEINRELIILTLPDSKMVEICRQEGLKCAHEAFADRAYGADGRLVPRDNRDALITSPESVSGRVINMITRAKLTTSQGQEIMVGKIDTVCIHSDTPNAIEIAKQLKTSLVQSKIEIVALGSFL